MINEDMRRLAVALGIQQARQMDIAELIQSIRSLEGQLPCYCEAWSTPCIIHNCPISEQCSSNCCKAQTVPVNN